MQTLRMFERITDSVASIIVERRYFTSQGRTVHGGTSSGGGLGLRSGSDSRLGVVCGGKSVRI